jgi:hypothetical protein
MIYINNTHKQGQSTTVVENKNAQNVQNKEKEINMRQEENTLKKLDTIEMKENERIEIKLPCNTIIDIFNSDNGAIIDVSHFRTKYMDEVKIKSCGRVSSQNYSWTEARTEFREDNRYVLVSHAAHSK